MNRGCGATDEKNQPLDRALIILDYFKTLVVITTVLSDAYLHSCTNTLTGFKIDKMLFDLLKASLNHLNN